MFSGTEILLSSTGGSLPSITDTGALVTSISPYDTTTGSSSTNAAYRLGGTATRGMMNGGGTTMGIQQDGTNWIQVSSTSTLGPLCLPLAGILSWSTSNTFNAAVGDTLVSRDAAGFVALKGSSNAIAGLRVYGGNGGFCEYGTATESLTIAAAATTDSVGNLLPANSIIDAVNVRVTTVIPTAATFTVGDATTAARFATGVAVAATTTAVGLTHVDQTGAAGPKQTAAAKIRITPNLTPGAATGVVRIIVHYRSFTAPTA